jgi:hypothetical protein
MPVTSILCVFFFNIDPPLPPRRPSNEQMPFLPKGPWGALPLTARYPGGAAFGAETRWLCGCADSAHASALLTTKPMISRDQLAAGSTCVCYPQSPYQQVSAASWTNFRWEGHAQGIICLAMSSLCCSAAHVRQAGARMDQLKARESMRLQRPCTAVPPLWEHPNGPRRPGEGTGPSPGNQARAPFYRALIFFRGPQQLRACALQ